MLLLYRQTYPCTALVLASSDQALAFQRPTASTSSTASPQIQLSLDPIDDFDAVGCTLIGKVHGCLGLVQLQKEIFMCVVTNAQEITSKFWTDEQTSKVLAVDFYSISSTTWDDGTPGDGAGTSGELDQSSSPSAVGQPQIYDHPASAMRKILSNGHFYFSSGKHDISTRTEERIRRKEDGDEAAYDPRFIWNSFLMDSLLDFRSNLQLHEQTSFDDSGFIVKAIQGYVGITDFTLSGNPVTLSLISRSGFARAGTRFNMRGIDDDGNVANYAETETIFKTNDSCFSFVQVRGSVPLFWEQSGNAPFGGQKLQITRPAISSQPAFNKHFQSLLSTYPHVQAINLLSLKDHEALLSSAYHEHIRSLNAQLGEKDGLISDKASVNTFGDGVGYTEFDFHKESRLAGGIESVKDLIKHDPQIGGSLETLGFCLIAPGGEKKAATLLHKQEGVFRTNCLDCLDRTNVVQDILSRLALEEYLRNLVPGWAQSEILWSAHRSLWAENGDVLSKMYAGTGALNSSFTRSGKRTFAGALSDATKSVSRLYISNFVDKGKQLAIDGLLGNLANQQKVVVVDPIRDSVESALRHREPEYSSTNDYLILTGTFNVNGKVPGSESLLPWLFPDSKYEPDIIALGFQELVELSPQQIMATDPAKLKQWQSYIQQAIAQRPKAKADYVLLRSEQLVGTCLIIFTKTTIAENVRLVEAATKKTGLKGIAGNKGAVAIRMELDDSTFCFVTAHFAAGHSNFEQRNLDYATIASGLQFRRGRRILAHENTLYFGDLNYRVSMTNDEVRHLATVDDFASLVEADQLTRCITDQSVFAGFTEGPLLFRPTYKYDNGTDIYDSSEKQRVPSWTDRILYRGDSLHLLRYDRAEVMMSDHRPVYALFKVQSRVIDHDKKTQIAKELLQTLSPSKILVDISNGILDGTLERTASPLPEPSSETQAWWHGLDFVVVAQESASIAKARNEKVSNPFENDYLVIIKDTSTGNTEAPPTWSSKAGRPSSAQSIKRKPPPPLLGSKPSLSPKPSLKVPPSNRNPSINGVRPQLGRGSSSNASLLDQEDEESSQLYHKSDNMSSEWEVIRPNQ